jgi:hypothetical protein
MQGGEAFEGERVRDRLVAALRNDLLGPSSPDEVLLQSPSTRYLVGMLAPRGTTADSSEDESLESESDEDGEDGAVRVSASLDPSSIGLSCVVDPGVGQIQVTASWGEYTKVERAEETDAEESASIDRDADPDATVKRPQKQYEWRRIPFETSVSLATQPTERSETEALAPGVALEWTCRRIGEALVISLFLMNCREAPADKRPPDELWLYQPKLELTGAGESFLPRARLRTSADPDPDVASADLIYAKKREFSTGHGVATNWSIGPAGDRATKVWTEVIPATEVALLEPRGAEGLPSLSMDDLAKVDAAGIDRLITPLLDAYGAWVGDREAEVGEFQAMDQAVGADHLLLARRALARMRSGAELLKHDGKALAAFRFANAAMAEQRRHTVTVLSMRRGEAPPADIAVEWRPFQIGFILLCLVGLADETDDDRGLADLLWFPTGGGKTEAYLGLTAFTLAHRRLADRAGEFDRSCGTSVLMRYTLRLLTIQQFGRALTLLCACERLREQAPETWGHERFTIGLWVGQSATPNNYEDARAALKELVAGRQVYDRSPYQVLFCPWCGHDLSPSDYVSDDDLERTLVKCANRTCDFASSRSELGLPVLMVDEEIYRNPPSLLVATVDKFAQMAWNGRIQSLYGRVSRRCPRHGFISSGEDHPQRHNETAGYGAVAVSPVEKRLAPPDLIIQDELHLISGPLGTLVGIYETAVEGLCAQRADGRLVRPKVVASTATIRRAARQIEALFARDVAVFPPLGLNADDSFFAKEAAPEAKPGRLYVGIYAPGKSVKTALVRAYAGMLSRTRFEYESEPTAEADSYMTLVGYFNSLRELGGALRLVEDDVPARLRVLEKRGFGPGRIIYETQELTSRKRSSQIPAVLKQLDLTFADRSPGAYPIDVLLASNMISVGVDIDRLGLMVVSGQPKTSAEYIQATSRVGRVHPGLVIEVYNWSRPRDTSHYERFRHYHETFYRHVEATSVTPFSARARDRALAGVLASYVRLDRPEMSAERSANEFDPVDKSVVRIVDEISARAREVTGRDEVGAETEQQLRNLIAEWGHWADHEQPLVYSGRGGKSTDERLVLLKPMERTGGRGLWPVAGSLREVEGEVDVILREGAEG